MVAFVPNMSSQTALDPHRSGEPGTWAVRRRRRPKPAPVRRRPTHEQGRGLEVLGHAIEYLVDSELNAGPDTRSAPTPEATQMLMRLSREVFADCREVVPFWQNISVRFHRFVDRRWHKAHVASAARPRS